MSKKVLITGGLGFVGSSLAQALVARGDKVRILDAKLHPYGFNEANIKEIRDQVELCIGDVRDLDAVKRCLEDVDAVVDLAAQVSHTLSIKDPILDVSINCGGAINVLEAVRQLHRSEPGRVRVVYGSTRGVVGRIAPELAGKIDENCLCQPTDINGANKFAAEKYYMLYHRVHGLSTSALRINNTYGPRCQIRNDDYGVVNWFVRRVVRGESIVMHGDGNQTRDYNYIDDVTNAFMLALDRPEAVGEVFWLGSGGPGVSLRHVVEKIISLAKSKAQIEFVPRPQGRQAIEVGDFSVKIEKIRANFGWHPQTDLDTGLKKTIEFYRERISDYVL